MFDMLSDEQKNSCVLLDNNLLISSPLLVQGSIADDKIGSSADGEEDGGREEPNKPESDKTEEGCGKFL